MASYQYVYHMENVSKTYPGGKTCFENIHLNFLPGVKIGVVGVNGAGKSTLLKIMAGMDKDFKGEAWAAKGAKVGYLPQEPQLDPNMTVGENVRAAFAELSANLARFNEISEKFAEEMSEEEMNNLLAEQAEALLGHPVTLVINNAGVGLGGKFDELFELAFEFLANPCRLWDSGRYGYRRLAQGCIASTSFDCPSSSSNEFNQLKKVKAEP